MHATYSTFTCSIYATIRYANALALMVAAVRPPVVVVLVVVVFVGLCRFVVCKCGHQIGVRTRVQLWPEKYKRHRAGYFIADPVFRRLIPSYTCPFSTPEKRCGSSIGGAAIVIGPSALQLCGESIKRS